MIKIQYVRDPFESKYELLINRKEKAGIKKIKNPKTFTDYSETDDDVYENLEVHNLTKKVLIMFDDMIADMKADKKLGSIVTELFLIGRKLNISNIFI